MSTSQQDLGLSPPLSHLNREGQLEDYIQDSYQDFHNSAEQDDDLGVVDGFDVFDNADTTANDFQHNPRVVHESGGMSTHAPSTMGTAIFKRPPSGGEDPSAGFRYAAPPQVRLDYVGKRKSQASNEREAPQLNPSVALCEVPVVSQATDADARSRDASYQLTSALSINVPLGHDHTALPLRRAEGVRFQNNDQSLKPANNHGQDGTRVTGPTEGVGEEEELPWQNDAQESHNHPDLGRSAKSASQTPHHLVGVDPRRVHTNLAQAGSPSHVNGAPSLSQTPMQSKETESYPQAMDGRPVRGLDPRAAQLKVPHKATKRRNTTKNSAKHPRGSKAGQIGSALQGAGGPSNPVNENQLLVVDGKCPEGFAGDIFHAPTESRPRSLVIEVDAPGDRGTTFENRTEPDLSLANEASTYMETHPQRALSPPNPTRNPVMQSNGNDERSHEVKVPAQDTAPAANPGLVSRPTPDVNKLANDSDPQSPPADQPEFSYAQQVGGESANAESHGRPGSRGNPQRTHPVMNRGRNQPVSRAQTPAGPSNDMHRVSTKHGPTKVGKSKRKAGPVPKQASEVAVPQTYGNDDDSGIMDILKILAWKVEHGQQRKAQASEAGARALENKIDTLIRENQLIWKDLRRTMHEKDKLQALIEDRDKVVNAKEQQIKKMERFLNGLSNDVGKCFDQLNYTRQRCEELEQECEAYRAERAQLENMATGCREKMVQIQQRLEAVGRDATSELDRLQQCHKYAETRLAEAAGLLSEERYRTMTLQQALEAASKNHRVLRENRQNQQAILGQLRDLREAITDSRNEDAATKEKVDECMHLVQEMQAADTVKRSDVQKLEELLRTMTESVFARLDELRLNGSESTAAQSSIKTCLEERLEALKADLVRTQSLNDEHAVLRESNATLMERSSTLESSVSRLRQELNDAKVNETSLSERLTQLETEKAALQHELQSGGVLSLRLQEVERVNMGLQSDLEKAQSELREETQRLRDREATEESTRNELQGLQTQLSEAQKRIDNFDAELEEKERQAEANIKTVRADLSKTAKKAKEDATMALETKLHQAKLQVEAKLKAAQDESESYKSTLDTLTKRDEAKELEIRRLKEEISMRDRKFADAKRSEETAEATRRSYASEVEKLTTDADAKVAKLKEQKDKEIEAMRHQLSSLQAAKDESDRRAEDLRKITQTQENERQEHLRHEMGLQQGIEAALEAKRDLQRRLENSEKQYDAALQEQKEKSRGDLEKARQHVSAIEGANGDLRKKVLELERQAHLEAEARRFGKHTSDQAGVQTKTPPNTTIQPPRKPQRTVNKHSTHSESIGRAVEGVDQPAPVPAGSQYEESHTNEQATLAGIEAEYTNLSQLEAVDENGISQVALRETVPETQYESLPSRFDDFKQGMGSQLLSSSAPPTTPVPPSSSASALTPASASPLPPLGGQSSYNPSLHSRILQPVAGNARLSTPQRSLPPKSPAVRSNTASKMSYVKPQNQSHTSSFEASDAHKTLTSQPHIQAQSVALAGPGDTASRSKEAGVQFSQPAESSPDFIMQRQPAGSHKVTKQRQVTNRSNSRMSGSQTQGAEHVSKPASMPTPALKRSRDATQQAINETPKRAKHVHPANSASRSSRDGARYATPLRNPDMITYSSQQSKTQASKGTAQSSQSLGSQSLMRSSVPPAKAKRSAGKGHIRTESYNTRAAAERFNQELGKS